MMSFHSNMPQLDLHGQDKISAGILVKDFINDNFKLRNEEFAIIHGTGQGILKKEVSRLLKRDKRVVYYGTDFYNLGCTLVKINVNIDKKTELCYNTAHNSRGGN